MTRNALIAAIVLAAASVAQAQTQSVSVQNAWSRATPPGAKTGAVYFTLTSPVDDKLVGASSPAANMAQVHEMKMDGNVMRMREVEGGLPLPAGKPVTLEPGGYHLMLMGLKAPLKQGQSVTVHLTFAKAPPQDVTAPVGAIGATHAPGSAAGAMPGMHMH